MEEIQENIGHKYEEVLQLLKNNQEYWEMTETLGFHEENSSQLCYVCKEKQSREW